MVRMSPLISTMVGSSPSQYPETISGVKDKDVGTIEVSKFKVHENKYPLSIGILSVMVMHQVPFKGLPISWLKDSTGK